MNSRVEIMKEMTRIMNKTLQMKIRKICHLCHFLVNTCIRLEIQCKANL